MRRQFTNGSNDKSGLTEALKEGAVQKKETTSYQSHLSWVLFSGSKRARDEEDDNQRRRRRRWYLRDWLTNWSSGLPVWHRSRSSEQIASSSQCTNATVVGITAIASCDGRDTPAIVRSMIRISPPPARIRHWLWTHGNSGVKQSCRHSRNNVQRIKKGSVHFVRISSILYNRYTKVDKQTFINFYY